MRLKAWKGPKGRPSEDSLQSPKQCNQCATPRLEAWDIYAACWLCPLAGPLAGSFLEDIWINIELFLFVRAEALLMSTVDRLMMVGGDGLGGDACVGDPNVREDYDLGGTV
jgi:hypothetical protein